MSQKSTTEARHLQIIDHIFAALGWRYIQYPKIPFPDEQWNQEDFDYLSKLYEEGIIEFSQIFEDQFDEKGEYNYTGTTYAVNFVNTLKLFEHKRRILGKYQKSIITLSTLERIARFIGNSGNAESIIENFKECDVPDYLVIYPNTKWRMVYDILKLLSTSIYDEGHRLLFSIIEEFIVPVRFPSIHDGIEKQKELSELLSYDGFEIKKGYILALPESKDMYDVYFESRTSGERIAIRDYDQIKDAVENSDYKKVTLIKGAGGHVERIEGERHIITNNETKFVDLKNAFPYSNITTSIHGGRVDKYVVTEKIRLSKNRQE